MEDVSFKNRFSITVFTLTSYSHWKKRHTFTVMQMVITVIRGYSEHKTVFAKSAGLLNLPGFPDVFSSHRIKWVLSFIWVLEIQQPLLRGWKLKFSQGLTAPADPLATKLSHEVCSKFLGGFFKAIETYLSVSWTCWNRRGGFLATWFFQKNWTYDYAHKKSKLELFFVVPYKFKTFKFKFKSSFSFWK